MRPELKVRATKDAEVAERAPGRWFLQVPAGSRGRYRLAQLDDYTNRARADFHWRPPVRLRLRARVSDPNLPGTWGFGLWNDPFSVGLGLGGTSRRLPTLPNAVWFFYASPPSYLSLRDNRPAQGFLAATFSASPVPAPLLALGLPAIPLLAWSKTATRLRGLIRRFVHQDAVLLKPDVTRWHDYEIDWQEESVRFILDREECFCTEITPRGRLGLVLWIDNQYAAFPPQGRLRFGSLANPEPAWLEIDSPDVQMDGNLL